MNQFEIQIRQWILKALLASKGPMPESVLKMSITSAFPNVAFTDGDVVGHIKDAQEAGLVAGTNDDVLGVVWELTPHGKIKAEKLR